MPPSGPEDNSGTGTDGEQDQQGTGTDSGQGTGNGSSGTGADGEQQNSDSGTGSETVSRADFDRLQRQLSEADRKREAAEQENKNLKAKDLSELEKAKQDAVDAVIERDALKGEVDKLRLANAFLSANKISWNNGEIALEIARSKGYLDDAISDKGEVDTKELEKALKKLSEEHKYLVKAASDEGDDDEEDKPGPSGAPGPRGKNSGDDKAKEERLKKMLPALGRR